MIIITKSAKALRTSIFLALFFFISFKYIILILLIFILYAFYNHNLLARKRFQWSHYSLIIMIIFLYLMFKEQI
jgi:hypothetical protein